MNNITLRDAFWDEVYQIAARNRDVLIVSADMGAPALDKFRRDLAAQYIDVGIAEQQAITVAAGLAMEGKKVFAYAIAPFITLRCYEQIRIELAAMNLPVTVVGVGAGMSYDDSGPTHHTVEDISIMRILPNMQVHSPSDNTMVKAFAQASCRLDHPNYIRLDRKVMNDIYEPDTDFSAGLAVLKESSSVYLVATSNMVHTACKAAERLRKDSVEAGVIDVYRFPIDPETFIAAIEGARQLITLEEHTLPGGLGSAVGEVLMDNDIRIGVKRIGLDLSRGYCYRYGGRENLQSIYGVDLESVTDTVRRICLSKASANTPADGVVNV